MATASVITPLMWLHPLLHLVTATTTYVVAASFHLWLQVWYAGEQLESISPPEVLSEATISEGTVVPGTLGEP